MRATALTTGVRKAIEASGIPSAGQTVVVGLSGGADSVALTDVLVQLAPARGFRVVVAHLDHALRRDSSEDARFCADLCERLGLDFHAARADVRARARRDGGGLEAAGRQERYAFLRRVRRQEGAVVVAVAHTQDDQAETFLLHLLRGAGRTGLRSMEAVRDDLLRPLLQVSRAQVLSHLRSRGLEWREDPSNRDLSIPRNRVRHELIPYLESRFNPSIRPALARSATLLGDETDLLAVLARELLQGASRRDGEAVVLSRRALSDAPRAIARLALREALADLGGQQDISAVHVNRILELAGSARPSGKRLALPGDREAVCCFGELRLGPRHQPRRPYDYPLSVPGQVELPGGSSICATPAPGPVVASDTSAVIVAPEAPMSMVPLPTSSKMMSQS